MSSITITPPTDKVEAAMAENSRNASKRRVILKWLSLALSLMILNIFCWETLSRFLVFVGKPPRSVNPEFEAKFQSARRMFAFDDNVVICGDSPMKLDFYPELVAAKLAKYNSHIKVVNLAASHATQFDATHYLQYLTDHGINIKLVIYNFDVEKFSFYKDADADDALARSKTYLYTGVLSRPKSLRRGWFVSLADNLYLSMYQPNFRGFLSDAFTIISSPKLFEQKSFFEPNETSSVEFTRAGMSPNFKIPFAGADQIQQLQDNQRPTPRSPLYPFNAGAYSSITSFCQIHKIPLLLVWPPEQSSVHRKYFYKPPYTEAWFKQIFDSYGKQYMVHTLDLNQLPEDGGYFLDYRNLNLYGSVKASELLADALSQPQLRSLIETPGSSGSSNK